MYRGRTLYETARTITKKKCRIYFEINCWRQLWEKCTVEFLKNAPGTLKLFAAKIFGRISEKNNLELTVEEIDGTISKIIIGVTPV